MKGVILAGGTGSRMIPLTRVTNKHLLPVGRVPMIYHPIMKMKEAGLRDIMVVTGRDHMGDVVGLLGSGTEFGLGFTFRVQEEAGGIAQALGLAEAFAAGDPILVILADNIFADSIANDVALFRENPAGARLFLKKVDDPGRYGVATLDESGSRIVGIVEKPSEPQSDLAVTGVYLYDSRIFSIVRGLRPSMRGELEITDVNNAYVEGGSMSFGILDGWWSDAGTPESYARANQLAADLDVMEVLTG